jgi:hypothetical protein
MLVTSGKSGKVIVADRCLFFTWPDFYTEMNAWSCRFLRDTLESYKNRLHPPPSPVYWFVIYLLTLFQLACYRIIWYLKNVNCEWEGIWKVPGVCQEATGNVLTEFSRCEFESGCASRLELYPLQLWHTHRKLPFPCYSVLSVITNPVVEWRTNCS